MMRKILLLAILFLLAGCGRERDTADYPEAGHEAEYTPVFAGTAEVTELPAQEKNAEEIPAVTLPAPSENPRNAVFLSAGINRTLIITECGGLWEWDGISHTFVMGNAVYAVAGDAHSLAIAADGGLYAWGCNHFGQLGDGTNEYHYSPVRVLENATFATIAHSFLNSHVIYSTRSFAITEGGALWGWGENGGRYSCAPGFLGDGTEENRNAPVQIMGNVVSFTPTVTGGHAVVECGTIWAWGFEWRTSLDDGTGEPFLSPIIWDPYNVYPRIFCYARPQFEIDDYGVLRAWGRNHLPYDMGHFWPPLGDGTTEYRESPVVIMENAAQIVIRGDAAYAITKTGELWAWGNNQLGQLGDGTTEPRFSPVKILENVASVYPVFWDDHYRSAFLRALALTHCGTVWEWGGYEFRSWMGGEAMTENLSPMRIVGGCS